MAMTSLPSTSTSTTGRFSITPSPRIATCGWLMIGVPKSDPKTPGFVTVKVPPRSSSGPSRFERARSARSLTAFARPTRLSRSALRTTGTKSPQSRATAIPRLTSFL